MLAVIPVPSQSEPPKPQTVASPGGSGPSSAPAIYLKLVPKEGPAQPPSAKRIARESPHPKVLLAVSNDHEPPLKVRLNSQDGTHHQDCHFKTLSVELTESSKGHYRLVQTQSISCTAS